MTFSTLIAKEIGLPKKYRDWYYGRMALLVFTWSFIFFTLGVAFGYSVCMWAS